MEDLLFTVIVADDEAELRDAVCRMIHWEELGFRLVGSAGNGLDALQLVEQLQPDLLLTDIQMPFITGTALARQVRELQPLIQVAFLSGYDDFEYAQSAIESDVIAYLLKPISMSELTEALIEIHGKMKARFDALRPSQSAGNLPLAVASLLLDSFNAQLEEKELRQTLAECGMVFRDPCKMRVLSTQAPDLSQDAAQTLDKVLRRYYVSCSIVSGSRILTLLIAEEGFSNLGAVLDELYYVAKRLLGEPCVIGVSRSFSRFQHSVIACREAIDAERLAAESGIYHVSELRAAKDGEQADEQDLSVRVASLLYGGNRQKLRSFLARTLPEGVGGMTAMQLLLSVQGVLKRSLEDRDVDALLLQCGLEDPLSAALDRTLFRSRVANLCEAGMDRLNENRREGMSYLCDQALQMIEQDFMNEDLSLHAVSERLHVSPNYLSANMKKYTGDTFINLLIKRRMEEALSLIRNGGMKIAEIAERCGYSDQHYFSYCFKKYHGMSPAKMRRREETT